MNCITTNRLVIMKTSDYQSPKVEIIDVSVEGCLCASSEFEGFSNELYDTENETIYEW